MIEKKVCYKDLSISLKCAVVGGWISLITFVLGFLIGFNC